MSHSPGLIDAWEIADWLDNDDQAGNLWHGWRSVPNRGADEKRHRQKIKP